LQNKLVLVTGASSGLGRSIAVGLGKYNCQLALLARRSDELEITARSCRESGAEKVECFPFDLNNYHDISNLISAVENKFGAPVQTLIHAAGQQVYGRLENIPLKEAEKCFNTNVMSFVSLVQAALPSMRLHHQGSIVLISSSIAHWGAPGFSIYSASKSSLERISESLRFELSPDNIRLTVISPGAIDTQMFWSPPTFGTPPTPPTVTPRNPDEVADLIICALVAGKEYVEISWRGRILRHLAYWIPGFLGYIYHKISGNIEHRKPNG